MYPSIIIASCIIEYMIVSNQIALPSCGDIMYSNFGDFLPQAQTKPGGQAARGVNIGEEFGVVAPIF